ncbi:DNA translocase FtsK 4TM domain-containing protein [Clostridium sp. 19966]|nr:DNA translocase FtsK 4TM domain-containing protein [Clostridium sp. 19966]MDT8716408.1 DNA translocase FtsK 4TM domain-containing protein [Clostridium sp. 19966]
MSRKKKTNALNYDIYGILLIALGILDIFSLITNKAGMAGAFIKKFMITVAGLGAFIFPIFIIFIGLSLIASRGKLSFNKKFYAILAFVLNTMFTLQLSQMDYFYNGSFSSGVGKIISYNGIPYGGIIGYIVDVPLYSILGSVGCLIVFSSAYLIISVIIFNLSLADIINSNKDKLQQKMEKRKSNKKIVTEKLEDTPKAVGEKTEYIGSINKKIKIMDYLKNTQIEDEPAANKSPEDKKILIMPESNQRTKKDVPDTSIDEELSDKIMEDTDTIPKEYLYPKIELLNINESVTMNKDDKKDLLASANKLESTLNSFGVDANVIQVTKGPSVTRYELQPKSGVKVSKIVNLSDDIALSLAAKGVRIEAPIPGKAAVGIEVPNKELMAVYLREVLESDEFQNCNKNIAFALGKDIAGKCIVTDLSKMPHLLIAGATGSGKSVCINTLIVSLLYKYPPEEVKLLMVDPKVVELSVYNGIPHLLIPVVTDPKKAAGALNWAVNEMTRRYKLFADNSVRNIEGYNELASKGLVEKKLPWIVMIVDELADLMMVCPGDIEDYIGRLAQMARAAGMHLVIATQRPSVDVITGVIKANIPSRISFAVSSQIDSRTILDSSGAEKLLGRGDMLFYPVGESKPIRIQGAFISEDEVERVVNFVKDQKKEENTEYKEEILNHINSDQSDDGESDELLEESIRIVVESGQASTSLLQRRLRVGYNRAARIIEQLEAKGIISGRDGSKPRQVLVDHLDYNDNEFKN